MKVKKYKKKNMLIVLTIILTILLSLFIIKTIKQLIIYKDEKSSYNHIMDVKNAPTITTYNITDGTKKVDELKQFPAILDNEKDIVNPIFTSFDSKLVVVQDLFVVGQNSIGRNLSTDVVTNHTMLYSIEFTTNAKEFIFSSLGSVRISIDENDGKGYQYTSKEGELDVDVDSEYLQSNRYNPSSIKFHEVSFNDSKERNVKIELMGAFENLYMNEQFEINTIGEKKGKTIMFVGDSWTTGYTEIQEGKIVELPFMSYPSIIANNLGMTAINLGVKGTGYTTMTGGISVLTTYQQRLEYSLNMFNPDIIVVCGGGNDAIDVKLHPEKKNMQNVAEAADACYKYVKKTKPEAQIIVLGMEYAPRPIYQNHKEVEELNNLLRQKAMENEISYVDFSNGNVYDKNGTIIITGNEPLVSNASDTWSKDGTHLTLDGYNNLANKLTPIIQQLIDLQN